MASAISGLGHIASLGSMNILIEAQADLHAPDDCGQYAIDYAVLGKQQTTQEKLEHAVHATRESPQEASPSATEAIA